MDLKGIMVEQKKKSLKGYILYNLIYNILKWLNYIEMEYRWVITRGYRECV